MSRPASEASGTPGVLRHVELNVMECDLHSFTAKPEEHV